MRSCLLPWLCGLLLAATAAAQDLISIRGSAVVARALALAAPALEKEHGIQINFVPEAAGLDLADKLGRDVFDIALYTRRVSAQESALRPEKSFTETLVGRQAVLLVVPDQVWKSGVRALTKEQFRAIYEGTLKNWKEVGGEDRDLVYYNREAGRGIWDLFMIFLYGDLRRAPLSKAEVLNDGNEVRTAVEFHGGSISVLEYGELKPGGTIHALGVKLPNGHIVEATGPNIGTGEYPLSRPLYFVTGKNPTGKMRVLIEYMLSKEGQECVRKAGHVPLADMEPARAK